LRRIHDIGIDDDSSKPKDRRKDTYDALIMIEFKMGKISKNGNNEVSQIPQVRASRSPTPPIIKGGVWLANKLFRKEETERRQP
jgi:hypothetical protein